MEPVQITLLSPRKLCDCGRCLLHMNGEERAAYEEAMRKLEEADEQDEEHSKDTVGSK